MERGEGVGEGRGRGEGMRGGKPVFDAVGGVGVRRAMDAPTLSAAVALYLLQLAWACDASLSQCQLRRT